MYGKISGDKCSTCLLCMPIIKQSNIGLINVAWILHCSVFKLFIFQPFCRNSIINLQLLYPIKSNKFLIKIQSSVLKTILVQCIIC